ncbi:MAG: response regulator [Proteobacteria bacterium]|nr:response regulator [Pseudomonadota bacterium]
MADLHHVSGKVTQSMLESAAELDWPFELDLAGGGVRNEQAVRDTSSWISWDEYQGVLRGLTGCLNTPEAFTEIGILSMEFSARGPFRHLGTVVGGSKPLYQATFGWVMQSMMKNVEMELSEVEPGRLRCVVRVDPSLGPSKPFFYTVAGTMTALPRNFGQADAVVSVKASDLEATYDIVLPSSTSVWARLRRSWSTLTDQVGYDTALVRLRESISELLEDVRAANHRLSESEARWRSLAEGIPGLVLVVGVDGPVRGPYGSVTAPPDVIDQVVATFRSSDISSAVLTGGEVATFEVIGGAKGGSWVWECRATRLPDEPHAVIVAVDDTERHHAQQALREREQRFLQSQKMEALGQLAGGIAHDFNNLLAAVQGHADLLEIDWGTEPAVAEHVKGIVAAVKEASALTGQLLAYGRATPTSVAVLDASELVRGHEAMYARLVGDPIQITTELAGEPLHVKADPSQVQQVLLNLVVNARDAMPGGGTITIRTQQLERDGDAWVDLEVCDEGTGMDEAVRQRAMEPFFTTKGIGRGTGLGLSTVYWIVEQAGGHVEIDTTPGDGTCVHILLPHAQPTDSPTPQVRRTGASKGTETILLVEDDDRVRRMVCAMLESRGYHVVACSHAADARRSLAHMKTPPALLLTDITMPGESGVQLANHVAAQLDTIAILLMSGYTAEAPELDAPHHHRGHFLAKPFGIDALTRSVREALDAAHAAIPVR